MVFEVEETAGNADNRPISHILKPGSLEFVAASAAADAAIERAGRAEVLQGELAKTWGAVMVDYEKWAPCRAQLTRAAEISKSASAPDSPEVAAAHVELGICLVRSSDVREALAQYERALAINQRNDSDAGSALEKNLHPPGSGARAGSLDPIGHWGEYGGRVMTTAFAALCLAEL